MVGGIAVGTASVNWGFDPLYTWVTTPTLADMLDQMEAAGYAGTEISYNFPLDVDALRAQLHAHNLRAAASFQAVDLRSAENHDQVLRGLIDVADRLAKLGSDVVILSDKPSARRLEIAGHVAADGSDGLDHRSWHAMCDGLNRAGALLADRAMHAVFHPHVGTYVETRSEIDRLCEFIDPEVVGLCPDTGHLAYAGVDPQDIFTDYADRIGYVHLKDVDRAKLDWVRSNGIGFVEAVRTGLFVELGTGFVGIDRIVCSLRAARYAGWLIVEQDAPADPRASAVRNRAYLRQEFGL
jgi:inosose dehydratase